MPMGAARARWEGSCNSTMGGGAGMFDPRAKPCAKLTKEGKGRCNGGGEADPRAKVCDWRGGRCVDTAVERKECRLARSAADCAAAPGPDNPFELFGEDEHLSWAQV